MKMLPANPQTHPAPRDFPDAASLAALRAWYEGLSARDAVVHYLGERKASGQSARGILGHIRRLLAEFARRRQRQDLAALFAHGAADRVGRAKAINQAIDVLRRLPSPEAQVTDDIGQWLPARAVGALRAHGIETLADLTVRIPRRRRWWTAVPGLGPASARRIEAFFAEHPQLTERARALIAVTDRGEIVPWEQLRLPHEVDGSSGTFRAPRQTCTSMRTTTTTRAEYAADFPIDKRQSVCHELRRNLVPSNGNATSTCKEFPQEPFQIYGKAKGDAIPLT